ncbi:MAG: helicase C-terminal domain-containing protein [Dehalococcoidia bacterium]
MPRSFVAIDVETTGLDVEHDRITEVGAVRFTEDGEEIESFVSLVNPGRPIPAFVERLTGVTNAAVSAAPSLPDIATDIVRFIGTDTLIGQNVGFDLAYLRRGGIIPLNNAVDTAALSRLLMPGRQARGLMDLAAALGVEAEPHHRALGDARTTSRVFVGLLNLAASMPAATRTQLGRLLSLHDPDLAAILGGGDLDDGTIHERALPAIRAVPPPAPLTRREPPQRVPRSRLDAVFAAGPSVIPGYEERSEQREMAETVRMALEDGGHWLIEAGTGVGKSLAYLAPAALHAIANGERIVVSTNTINLQEQLFQKDLPALREMLVASGAIQQPGDLRVALLKGRGNYLCLRRWIASYAANLGDPDFARLASAMLLWLPETETGDRSELALDNRDYVTWQRFSAQDADCLQRPNAQVKDGTCFLQRARKGAEAAHIIVVNHALLLADLAAGGSALPSFDHLVVDEAHNLEDVATRQFGSAVSQRLIGDALDGLHRPRARDQREGGVAALLRALPDDGLLTAAADALVAAAAEAALASPRFFAAVAAFLPRPEEERMLIDPGLRAQPGWTVPEEAWGILDTALGRCVERAEAAARIVSGSAPVEEPDAIAGEVVSVVRRVQEVRARLESMMSRHEPESVVWLSRDRDGSAALNSAPLDVGPLLWEDLFSRKKTVIATSATLATGARMDFTARRLGLEDPATLQLGSPFDYKRAALLCAVDDLPEPGQPGYDDAVAAAVAGLVRASGGRALVLFTSHGALQRVASRVRPDLERDGIAVLAQGIDGPPRQLTENLVAQPRSVILGTSSFWEGVDIRGDALSLLVIARLPFSVPTDPVFRSRSEQYEDPFREYSLPSAILRFRQGFGRLIRDHSDRGAVAVLDRRIFARRYGEQFISALPECTRVKGSAAEIVESVEDWLQS